MIRHESGKCGMFGYSGFSDIRVGSQWHEPAFTFLLRKNGRYMNENYIVHQMALSTMSTLVLVSGLNIVQSIDNSRKQIKCPTQVSNKHGVS